MFKGSVRDGRLFGLCFRLTRCGRALGRGVNGEFCGELMVMRHAMGWKLL